MGENHRCFLAQTWFTCRFSLSNEFQVSLVCIWDMDQLWLNSVGTWPATGLGDSEMAPAGRFRDGTPSIVWWLNNIHYPHLKKHHFHQDLAAHLWQLNPWFHRCNFAAASALFFARGTLSHLFNGVSSLCRWPCHVTCHPTFETYGLFDHM